MAEKSNTRKMLYGGDRNTEPLAETGNRNASNSNTAVSTLTAEAHLMEGGINNQKLNNFMLNHSANT